MELLLDTANIEQIKHFDQILPIDGITTNPTILKQEGHIPNLYQHLKNLQQTIGKEKQLHVQVISTDYQQIIKEAQNIQKTLGPQTYIKIPITKEGLKAIKILKPQNYKITGTAIYTQIQGILAIQHQCDYIAPYYNRMENQNINPNHIIKAWKQFIEQNKSNTKILGASYKNLNQVNQSIENGAHAITIQLPVAQQMITNPTVDKAIQQFKQDFEDIYGPNQTM